MKTDPIAGTDAVNNILIALQKNDTIDIGKISDGYHTFDELYDHRVRLYITLCKLLCQDCFTQIVWHSDVQSDGSSWAGWFLLGIGVTPCNQITYHLPMQYWDEVHAFSSFKAKAPDFDGHTSADVLERLKTI